MLKLGAQNQDFGIVLRERLKRKSRSENGASEASVCQVLKKVYTFYINTKIRLQFKYNSKIYLQPPFFCNNFSIYNLPF